METDNDREFFEAVDLVEMDRTLIESAIEKFDETSFDSFTYCSIFNGHEFQYICYKVFQIYNLIQGF